MDFSTAFNVVKNGGSMRLPRWRTATWVTAQFPDEHSKMTNPYLYVASDDGQVPWYPSQSEMFTDEWEVSADDWASIKDNIDNFADYGIDDDESSPTYGRIVLGGDGIVHAEKVIGSRYIVTARNHIVFNKGDTVTLIHDDGSDCPYFQNEEGLRSHIYLDRVRLIY